MALKRTRRPFYGKANAFWDKHAREYMRQGNHEHAKELFDASRAKEQIRMVHHANMMAHRPIGQFMKASRGVAYFLRNYT